MHVYRSQNVVSPSPMLAGSRRRSQRCHPVLIHIHIHACILSTRFKYTAVYICMKFPNIFTYTRQPTYPLISPHLTAGKPQQASQVACQIHSGIGQIPTSSRVQSQTDIDSSGCKAKSLHALAHTHTRTPADGYVRQYARRGVRRASQVRRHRRAKVYEITGRLDEVRSRLRVSVSLSLRFIYDV